MPELPEVETMVRNLRRWLGGQTTHLQPMDPRLDLEPRQGRVQEVSRRAKYALIRTEAETWVLHFRMTGEVVRGPAERFVRARFTTPTGVVDFVDPRRFGTIHALEDPAPLLRGLGDEPWPERRDAAWWKERVGDSSAPLKPTLMQQDRVAGLGNIAAAEICFRAGLDPSAPARDTDWEALAEAAFTWLQEAVEDTAGERIEWAREGHRPAVFAVYGREDEPCPRCGAPIRRFHQAGRSTFACPQCQPRRASVR